VPPTFQYEAPKDDSYKNFQSTGQFVKRYILLFPVALYCFYELAFERKNHFSGKKEFKLFSRTFEANFVGKYFTRRILHSRYKNLVYKQDTEEVKLVDTCARKLLEANQLQKFLPSLQIKVLHLDNTVGMFLSPD